MLVTEKVTGPAGAEAWSSSQPPLLVRVICTWAAPPDTGAPVAAPDEWWPGADDEADPADDDPHAASETARATVAPTPVIRERRDSYMRSTP